MRAALIPIGTTTRARRSAVGGLPRPDGGAVGPLGPRIAPSSLQTIQQRHHCSRCSSSCRRPSAPRRGPSMLRYRPPSVGEPEGEGNSRTLLDHRAVWITHAYQVEGGRRTRSHNASAKMAIPVPAAITADQPTRVSNAALPSSMLFGEATGLGPQPPRMTSSQAPAAARA